MGIPPGAGDGAGEGEGDGEGDGLASGVKVEVGVGLGIANRSVSPVPGAGLGLAARAGLGLAAGVGDGTIPPSPSGRESPLPPFLGRALSAPMLLSPSGFMPSSGPASTFPEPLSFFGLSFMWKEVFSTKAGSPHACNNPKTPAMMSACLMDTPADVVSS